MAEVSSVVQERAAQLKLKFEQEWDGFTRMVSEHPKTGIAISFGAGMGAMFLLSIVL